MNSSQQEKNIRARLQFLENQVVVRDREIHVLQRELEEKKVLVDQLSQPHLRREQQLTNEVAGLREDLESFTHQLAEMTDMLTHANTAIELLQKEKENLAHQLEELHTNNSKTEADQKEFATRSQMRHRIQTALTGASCFAAGFVPFVLTIALPGIWQFMSYKPMQLKAHTLPPISAAATVKPALPTPPPPEATRISREVWLDALGSLHKTAFGEALPTAGITQAYEKPEEGFALTQAEYLDIVTGKPATSLPSGILDGLVLTSFGAGMVDASFYDKQAHTLNIPHANLCQPGELDVSAFRRVAIFVSDSLASLDCLNRAISSPLMQHKWQEISIISLTDNPTFAMSATSAGRHLVFQEWNTDWLTKLTTAWTDSAEPETPPLKRALRLANISRSFVRPGDVRIVVPFQSAEKATAESKASELSLGNFAMLPVNLPAGPVKAVRTKSSEADKAKQEASVTVSADTRAVIISESGNKLAIQTEKKQ